MIIRGLVRPWSQSELVERPAIHLLPYVQWCKDKHYLLAEGLLGSCEQALNMRLNLTQHAFSQGGQ